MGACVAAEAPKGPPAQVISSPPANYANRNINPQKTTATSGVEINQQVQPNVVKQPDPPNNLAGQHIIGGQTVNTNSENTSSDQHHGQRTSNGSTSSEVTSQLDQRLQSVSSVKNRVKTPPGHKIQRNSETSKRKATPPPPKHDTHTDDEDDESEEEKRRDEDDDDDVKEVNVNEETVKQFMVFEEQIIRLERTYSKQKLEHNHASIKSLKDGIDNATRRLDELKRQTVKEYNDVVQMQNPSVKALFVSQAQHDAAIEKEQREYIDALNRQEVAEKELDALHRQYDTLKRDHGDIEKGVNELKHLREEQDKLLEHVFNNKYGSELEYKLELELEMMEDKQQRVSSARYRWQCARYLLNYATNQLNFAVRRWHQLEQIHYQQFHIRYQMIAETRNNLIASLQNINNAYRYLPNIQLPYVGSDYTDKIALSINTIFNDAQNNQIHNAILAGLGEYYKKCSYLGQWCNQVLTQTIATDLNDVMKEYNRVSRALRDERLRLLEEKAKAIIGESYVANSIVSSEINDENIESEKEPTTTLIIEPEPVPQTEEEKASDEQAPPPPEIEDANQTNTTQIQEESEHAVMSVPLSDLAPPPTQEELFGNIENLRKQHEDELAEFERVKNINRQRADQGLQEKLRRRRSKRRKQQQETIQAHMLTNKQGVTEEVITATDVPTTGGDGTLP